MTGPRNAVIFSYVPSSPTRRALQLPKLKSPGSTAPPDRNSPEFADYAEQRVREIRAELRKRHFEGEGAGKVLAGWLQNGTSTGKARVRISTLIETINRMTSLVEELRRRNLNEEVAWALELHDELTSEERAKLRADLLRTLQQRQSGWPPSDEAEELRDSINEQLGFYTGAVLELSTFDQVGNGIFKLYVRGRSRAKSDEWHALDLMMMLIRKGLLHRFRKCGFCSCFFYARFDHQVQCKPECRRKKYRSSESWKEDNRRRRREYYHLHKHKNVVTRGGI